jgi:hypothetical protein
MHWWLKDSFIPTSLTAVDLSSGEGVTWAHPDSLEPVTKGGNSGIPHTGDDYDRAKSPTFRFTNNVALLYF